MSTSAVGSGSNSAAYDAINSANQSAAAAAKGASAKSEAADSAQDRFLKLLTAQLKNQDPLNPLDNAQMTSQLAQISTVDGITRLNTTMQSLLGNSSSSQTLQAAALVGHTVLAPGNGLALAGGKSVGGLELATAADEVVATIKDSNGLLVRTLNLGAQPAGVSNFVWDGAADSGALAVDGNYRVSFSAKQGGKAVDVTGLEYATVSSVAKNSQGVTLTVGNLGTVALADIKQIL
jgi:flagellar basal-body rod modification protein FlgD